MTGFTVLRRASGVVMLLTAATLVDAGAASARAAGPDCHPVGGLNGGVVAKVVHTATRATEWLTRTSYRVTVCDKQGDIIRSQAVGRIRTPGGGTALVPQAEIRRLANGRLAETSVTYGDPRDPRWARAWSQDARRVAARVLAPQGTPPATTDKDQVGAVVAPQPNPGGARCNLSAGNRTGFRHDLLYIAGYNYNSFPGAKDLVEIAVKNFIGYMTANHNACGWSTITPFVVLTGRTNSTANPYAPDNSAVIDWGVTQGLWPAPCNLAVVLACTVAYADANRLVREQDIRFNRNYSWWAGNGNAPAGYYDIMSAGAHEVGHSLGLSHTDNTLLPTMQGSNDAVGPGGNTSACCVGRFLSGSDFRALQAIYGAAYGLGSS